MSRLPRNNDPIFIRHISIRTERAALRLLPSPKVNGIVGGIIARYQEEFSIVIFAYTVLSNHIHILAQAPRCNLWRFEQAVNREIAKRLNRQQGMRGHFWERRYDEQMVAEEGDAVLAFLYVICNAVSHGLVEHPSLWPGLNSYAQVLDGKDRVYRFTDYTAYGKARRQARGEGKRVSIRDFESEHVLRISPLPKHAYLSQEERRAVILRLVSQRTAEIKKERKALGLGFLGREKVLRQDHNDIPRNVKRSRKPICYTKSWEAKKLFMSWFYPWLEAFREASRRFRRGEFLVKFPEYCLLPPLHYSIEEA